MSRKFTWQVEVTLDESMVADGMELTTAQVQKVFREHFGYATPEEVTAAVTNAPPQDVLREVKGYATA